MSTFVGVKFTNQSSCQVPLRRRSFHRISASSSEDSPTAQNRYPLPPAFMLNQEADVADEESEEAAPPPEKPSRPRPKKLNVSEKAVMDWGWTRGNTAEGAGLESWLTSRGLPRQKVSLQAVKEGGRGLVAREKIGKGEAILFVPEKLLITQETAFNCPAIGSALRAASLPAWPAIAVFLLSQVALEDKSEWHSYIEALPKAPGCILQWSLDEVDVLLEGSPIKEKAVQCIADVTDTFRDLEEALFAPNRELFPEEVFTLGAFKWAFAILFSRLVRLPSLPSSSPSSPAFALVPWADMLNHRCEVNAFIDYDPSKRAVVLKTDREYQQGTQVYASYGPRPNGDLLLAYGIILATRNPHNAVDIRLGLIPGDEREGEKRAALVASGLSSPMAFPVKMEGVPSQLMAFARIVAAGPETSAQELKDLSAVAASTSPSLSLPFGKGSAKDKRLEEQVGAREVVLAAVQLVLSGYPTSLQDDEAILSGVVEEYLEDDGEQRVRVQGAAALRVSERRILHRTEFVLRAELRELRSAQEQRAGRTKVALGNNFKGGQGGLMNSILSRIVRAE